MGEGGAIGSPAAVCNAIEDALAPWGVEVTEQYLPPSRILQLIFPRQSQIALATSVVAVNDNPIGERRPIRIADIEWEDFTDPDEPDREPGPFVRWLVDPASGNRVMHVKSWAGRNAAAHGTCPTRCIW